MQIERYRRRWLRRTLNRCTAALIGTMVFCTGITVCAAYSLHMELQQVNKQQTDTLDTLMWHRISTESELVGARQENEAEIVLSEADRDLITRTVMSEANTLEGMMAVAQVIHNRAVLWNMTPSEAATQPGQFAEPAQGAPSGDALQAVAAVFDEGHRVFDSNVTHFHSMDFTQPYWTKGKECVGEAGGNRFWI